MTETYEEHMRQVLAAGGAHECASDCPLPAMTEDRVPTQSLDDTLRAWGLDPANFIESLTGWGYEIRLVAFAQPAPPHPWGAMTEDRVPITGTESTARRCEMQHDGSYRAMTEDRVPTTPPPHEHIDGCGHNGEGVEPMFMEGWRSGRAYQHERWTAWRAEAAQGAAPLDVEQPSEPRFTATEWAALFDAHCGSCMKNHRNPDNIRECFAKVARDD